jgi:hypothetical protein
MNLSTGNQELDRTDFTIEILACLLHPSIGGSSDPYLRNETS